MLVDDTLEAALPRARRFIDRTRPQKAGESTTRTVAEVGINHCGSVEVAKRIMDVAHHCGCTHVKFQKRAPDKCVPDAQRDVMRDTPDGEMRYIEYKHRIELGESAYDEIYAHAKDLGIDVFASVWDLSSVDFMARRTSIGKIPSALITNDALLAEARSAFDTLIISTGMSTEVEIEHAVSTSDPDVIMHSVSTYPSFVSELNLRYIRHLAKKFDAEVGYSGHELQTHTAASAVALGAKWIERHVTLDRDAWGSDQRASLPPDALHTLIRTVQETESALGPARAADALFERTLVESEREKRWSLRGA